MVFTILGAVKFELVTHVNLRKSTQIAYGKSRKKQTDKEANQTLTF